MGDVRRHRRVPRVVAQHFFHGGEFVGRVLLGLLVRKLLFLLGLTGGEF